MVLEARLCFPKKVGAVENIRVEVGLATTTGHGAFWTTIHICLMFASFYGVNNHTKEHQNMHQNLTGEASEHASVTPARLVALQEDPSHQLGHLLALHSQRHTGTRKSRAGAKGKGQRRGREGVRVRERADKKGREQESEIERARARVRDRDRERERETGERSRESKRERASESEIALVRGRKQGEESKRERESPSEKGGGSGT
eukprot:4852551-Pleurochrysis_carterae.AAC.1